MTAKCNTRQNAIILQNGNQISADTNQFFYSNGNSVELWQEKPLRLIRRWRWNQVAIIKEAQ